MLSNFDRIEFSYFFFFESKYGNFISIVLQIIKKEMKLSSLKKFTGVLRFCGE